MNKSMMLITSAWGAKKTFKLIPISPDNEAIFDFDNKVLAVVSREKKDSLHMLAKLNEFGDPQTMKIGKRANGKDYAEERKTLETYYEYYVEKLDEIESLIKMFAINEDSFDYKQYFVEETKPTPSSIVTV